MEHQLGVSTRLVSGLVMTHGDDIGLRIPPLLAPIELVIVPITRDEERTACEAADRVMDSLEGWELREPGRLRVHIDDRDGMTRRQVPSGSCKIPSAWSSVHATWRTTGRPRAPHA